MAKYELVRETFTPWPNQSLSGGMQVRVVRGPEGGLVAHVGRYGGVGGDSDYGHMAVGPGYPEDVYRPLIEAAGFRVAGPARQGGPRTRAVAVPVVPAPAGKEGT